MTNRVWNLSPLDLEMNNIINKFENEIEKEDRIVKRIDLEKERNTQLIGAIRRYNESETTDIV